MLWGWICTHALTQMHEPDQVYVMLVFIACLSIVVAAILLLVLSIIDIKTFLLPNELVLGVLVCGIVFHAATLFQYVDFINMILGGLIGFSLLYLLRGVTEFFYKRETLGLGDVKLMGAAGVWLGPDYILPAITVGAICGVFHGLGLALFLKCKEGKFPLLNNMVLPAGPGFALGSAITMAYMLLSYP